MFTNNSIKPLLSKIDKLTVENIIDAVKNGEEEAFAHKLQTEMYVAIANLIEDIDSGIYISTLPKKIQNAFMMIYNVPDEARELALCSRINNLWN